MNLFYNPYFIIKTLKSYIFEINRLKKFSESELRRYQNKKLRKIVKHAFSVKLYHDKYKKMALSPEDIKVLEDIEKLPFITRKDIKEYYPDGVISSYSNKKDLISVSTSGTTGDSLTFYSEMFEFVLWLFWYIRVLRDHNINWRNDQLTIIADFAPNTIASGYISKNFNNYFKNNRFFSNIQWLNTNDRPEKIIDEINNFNPDFLGGYVGMLSHLALLKDKGKGKNINPKSIATIGSVLTSPLRKLLESVFCSEVFEVYGATESGTIAYQCNKNKKYHIMSDLVHPEFIKEDKPVKANEPGKIVITKLYGKGTPFIRYKGLSDLVIPDKSRCSCGTPGLNIKKILGRDDLALFFSDGRILLPVSISEIHGRILYELRTNMVRHTRIVQPDEKHIEISLVLDKEKKKDGVTSSEIFSILRKGYHDKIGDDVEITIKEVNKVKKGEQRIVSYMDKERFEIKEYI